MLWRRRIDEALVTCDEDNLPSRAVIEGAVIVSLSGSLEMCSSTRPASSDVQVSPCWRVFRAPEVIESKPSSAIFSCRGRVNLGKAPENRFQFLLWDPDPGVGYPE